MTRKKRIRRVINKEDYLPSVDMNALTVRVFLVGVGNESAVIRSDAVDGVIVRDPVVIVVFVTVISDAVVIRVKLRAVWNVGAVISSVLVSVSITENTQHSTL